MVLQELVPEVVGDRGALLAASIRDMTLVRTIGHSPISLGFIAMLRAHGVTKLVDVCTIRGSRHNPQYGEIVLAESGFGWDRVPRDVGVGCYLRCS